MKERAKLYKARQSSKKHTISKRLGKQLGKDEEMKEEKGNTL
jgi:hypothetical protein